MQLTKITDFDQIVFDEAQHRYWYQDQVLTSATRTLRAIKPPFDAQAVAERVASKQGRTVRDVLTEWDLKREWGTRVHKYIEWMLGGGPAGGQVIDAVLMGNNLPEMRAFDAFWDQFRTTAEPEVSRLEWIVGDAALGVAGTVDALLLNRKLGTLHLFDWKTGGKFRAENSWESLLPPFEYLDNCEYHNYSLQISLYRLIIERNTDLNLGVSYLVHLMKDGSFEMHEALDLREPLLAWLTGESPNA